MNSDSGMHPKWIGRRPSAISVWSKPYALMPVASNGCNATKPETADGPRTGGRAQHQLLRHQFGTGIDPALFAPAARPQSLALACTLTQVFYHRQVCSHFRQSTFGFCDLGRRLPELFLRRTSTLDYS